MVETLQEAWLSLQMCQETGCSPNWAKVRPGVQQLDEVNRVLMEEAHFAARRPKPLIPVQLTWETAAQGRSWFSMASNLLVVLSQLMWKQFTRGFEAKMFHWS